MNALIAIRKNATGLLSPTPEVRQKVVSQLGLNARAASAVGASSVLKMAEGEGSDTRSEIGLDRDAFLRLLVLQLQNQDPLSPMDSGQMITQLATFASLEQMQSLNSEFQRLSGSVDQLNFITANSLVGRSVRGVDVNGQVLEGEVEGIQLNGSVVLLRVNGVAMPMTGVLEIFDGKDDAAPEAGE